MSLESLCAQLKFFGTILACSEVRIVGPYACRVHHTLPLIFFWVFEVSSNAKDVFEWINIAFNEHSECLLTSCLLANCVPLLTGSLRSHTSCECCMQLSGWTVRSGSIECEYILIFPFYWMCVLYTFPYRVQLVQGLLSWKQVCDILRVPDSVHSTQ